MDNFKDTLASRLYAKMQVKPRPPKNDDGAVADNKPSIDYVQGNERTKRKVTPMTMLSPSCKQTFKEAQNEEDRQYEKSTARHDDYEGYNTEFSCESSDNKSPSGTYDQTKYDKYSDCEAQKQAASDFGGEQLASRRTSTLSACGGQSTSDTDIGGYDLVPNAVLNNLIEEHDKGRKTHNTTQRHSIRGREHATVSIRRHYTDDFREQFNDNTASGGLGDINYVPQLTAEKRPSRRQRHEHCESTVIEDMIDQISRADELAQEYRREDLAHEQHHYGVLASASVGKIVLTEAGRKQRTILFTSVDPDGMRHSHSFCDNKIETESKPRHGRYYIRTDTELEEFPVWGLQKLSIRLGSHATPYEEFGRRCDNQVNLVSIDNETIYCASDRDISKAKAIGSFSITGEKNVLLEKDLAGSKRKANGRFDSAARTQRANSFDQKNGRVSGYDADVNEGPHGLSKSTGLLGFESAADEQSFSSEYGQSSHAPSDYSEDEAMPPTIPMLRSHGSPCTPKKASGGSCRRFVPEPLGSGLRTPSRMDHEQVEVRSSSFMRGVPAEVVNSVKVSVLRTPTTPSAGRNPRPLSSENLFLGENPYKKLLDRKVNPRSKSSTPKSSRMSSGAAVDHVIQQSAPSLSFLGDTPAANNTSEHGLAQAKKRGCSKKFQKNHLQFDPSNGEEVENFLIESITPPAQKLLQQGVANYSQGSAHSKASARGTSSKLTEEEALGIVVDTLFAPDKPKNPFGVVLNPSAAESSLLEESKYKPRRKSMLSQQLCWLSSADDKAHLRSRKGLSDEGVSDSESASSLPFQKKREHSSKMRLTMPSICPVDSFSSSMKIGSRGTVVSSAASTAMGPGQTSDLRPRISPLALHDLDTRLNDSFLPKRLLLKTPMETTNYILDSRRRASKLALHRPDIRLHGPLERFNLRTPTATMQIMDETQEGCVAVSTTKSLVQKKYGSFRQKVSSGLSLVANMMKIKVEEEDEGLRWCER